MTIQEVRALIDAKIKGQGTNVDAGSVLPIILNGMLDLIDAGGGGGTSDAVQYIPQELTESQQMQARKNLDLYYETEQQTNTVNGTDEGEIYADIWKHISDDTPNRARKIVSVKRGEEEVAFSVDDTMIPEGYMVIKNEDGDESWFLVIISPNSHYQGLPAGIYVATSPATVLELSLEYVTAEGETVKIPEKFLPDTPSSDPEAVKYVEQELSDAEKMQARKNQGLYYEGIEIAEQDITLSMFSNSIKTYTWKGVLFYFQWDNPNQTPYPAPRTIADVESFGWNASGQTTEMDVVVGENAALVAEGVYVLYGPDADPEIGPSSGVESYQYCIVAFEGNEESLDAGFYYPTYSEMYYPTKYIASVKYLGGVPTIHRIEPKYIKDMYYEEEGTQSVQWDGDTSGRESGSFYYSPMMPALTAYKVSDEVLTEDIIKSILTNSHESSNPLMYQQANYLVIECYSGSDYAFIVNQDYTGGGGQANVSKGIYFTADIIELVYADTIVHQIPAKYIPDMPSGGLDVFEIEFSSLNPQSLGTVELPNYTYEQIADAVASGKLLVLTLKQDGENVVWGRYIGGQRSRMSDPENDYGRECVRFPAAYSYLEQTIQGNFIGTKIQDIVIYNDWPIEADEPTLMLTVEDSFNV